MRHGARLWLSTRPPCSTAVVCWLLVQSLAWSSVAARATTHDLHEQADAAAECAVERWIDAMTDASTCSPLTTPHDGNSEPHWLWNDLADGIISPYSGFSNLTWPDFLNQSTDWTAIRASFIECVLATWSAVIAWLFLLRLLSVPVLAGLLMVVESLLPHTRSLVLSAYQSFRSLAPGTQAVTLASFLCLVVAWRKGYFARAVLAWKRFKSRCRQAHRNFRRQVAVKSKIAAFLLPHIIYAIVCHIVATFSPAPVLGLLSHGLVFAWLSTFYPVYKSIRAVKAHRYTDQPATVYLERSLHYWILWAFYVTAHCLVTTLLPRFVLGFFHPSPLRVNFFLYWLHAMNGAQVLYRFAVNYVYPYYGSQSDAAASLSVATIEHAPPVASTNVVLRTLTAVGLVSNRTANVMGDLMAQGPALCGLVFLVTPGFLTNVGCGAVAFAFPAYVALGTLARNQRRTHEWWVCYFTVVAVAEYSFGSLHSVWAWVPFVYHVKLVGMLWLQFPYFRGAQSLFDVFFNNVLVDPRRSLELGPSADMPSNPPDLAVPRPQPSD
ncbi:hypothetical protein DYB35_003465 [Aphanomyces astaci]|uniref:Uncharacterized protein n=1 Tax=Aphanomyces astaci TaxID=112090 RepID=A0A418DLA9_APHAT|nr:hypothetical protein DYB35_003465 [Aphanomyces astaci]